MFRYLAILFLLPIVLAFILFLIWATEARAAVRGAEVFAQVNAERTAHGLPALTVSPALVKAAQAKANDMAVNGYFAHKSPIGKCLSTFLGLAGYRYSVAGENLAQNWMETGPLVQAWMKSPTHRANILDDFRETGIGIAEGKQGTLIVQLFGTRL